MEYLYGEFTTDQLSKYKKRLHSSFYWLLNYIDPQTKESYKNVDLDKYLSTLLHKASGLSSLFGDPPEYVEMMALLQEVLNLHRAGNLEFWEARRIILKLHTIVDTLPTEGGESDV